MKQSNPTEDDSGTPTQDREISAKDAELLRSLLPLVISFDPDGVPVDQGVLPHDLSDLIEIRDRIDGYLKSVTPEEHDRTYNRYLKARYPDMYEQMKRGDDDAD